MWVSRSKALGHGVCLKSISGTFTVQDLMLATTTGVEKHILKLELR